MRKSNLTFAYAHTKAKISCAVTAPLFSLGMDRAIPLSFNPLAVSGGCKVRFVSDLVGYPENRFPDDEAQLMFNNISDIQNCVRIYACS